eukprot:scaffold298091_cov28-Prasinocladus_malaysianus.AAC.1
MACKLQAPSVQNATNKRPSVSHRCTHARHTRQLCINGSSWLRGTAIPIRERARGASQRPAQRQNAPKCCWSLEVSLATSAFVALATTKLVIRNGPRDRGNAVFLGVFGSMQLVDAMLWWEQSGGAGLEACSMFNRLVSRLAIGIILLEPIVALIGTSMIANKAPSAIEVSMIALPLCPAC